MTLFKIRTAYGKWKLEDRIAEIIQQPVRILNATVGKPYEAKFDLKNSTGRILQHLNLRGWKKRVYDTMKKQNKLPVFQRKAAISNSSSNLKLKDSLRKLRLMKRLSPSSSILTPKVYGRILKAIEMILTGKKIM